MDHSIVQLYILMLYGVSYHIAQIQVFVKYKAALAQSRLNDNDFEYTSG